MSLTIISDELVKDNYRLATDARAFSQQLLQQVFKLQGETHDGDVVLSMSKEGVLCLVATLQQLANNVNPRLKS
jgi:hypothetical protein